MSNTAASRKYSFMRKIVSKFALVACVALAIALTGCYPDSAWAYNSRGVVYILKEDYNKAISDFTKAILLEPKYVDAYKNRGIAYYEKGDYDKAISDYSEVIKLDPNDAAVYRKRGFTYDKKGDHDKAISDYSEAIRLEPKNALAYYRRGIAYGIKGDHDKAIADYESALRIDPNDSDARKARNDSKARKAIRVFTDKRDGKKYKNVKIGNQTWMAENLNYNASGSKCYENKPTNCEKYGRLYNWATAKNACPSGWHLPSKSEYETLDRAVGGEKVAGKKLKAESGWNNNGNGTDEFGFSALPGGNGRSDGSFSSAGFGGYWWSASEINSSYAYTRYMNYYLESANWGSNDKSYLFSVRCLQD